MLDPLRTAAGEDQRTLKTEEPAKRAGIWDKDEWDASANADLSPADESNDESADAPAEKSKSATLA